MLSNIFNYFFNMSYVDKLWQNVFKNYKKGRSNTYIKMIIWGIKKMKRVTFRDEERKNDYQKYCINFISINFKTLVNMFLGKI